MEWNDVNKMFALCGYEPCPRREECLRYTAGKLIPETYFCWNMITPSQHRQVTDEGCPSFATNKPQHLARGFKQALNQVSGGQMAEARRAIMERLDIRRNCFYEKRNGKRLLNAEEQQAIAEVLARFGVPEPIEFDAYEDTIYWL